MVEISPLDILNQLVLFLVCNFFPLFANISLYLVMHIYIYIDIYYIAYPNSLHTIRLCLYIIIYFIFLIISSNNITFLHTRFFYPPRRALNLYCNCVCKKVNVRIRE